MNIEHENDFVGEVDVNDHHADITKLHPVTLHISLDMMTAMEVFKNIWTTPVCGLSILVVRGNEHLSGYILDGTRNEFCHAS